MHFTTPLAIALSFVMSASALADNFYKGTADDGTEEFTCNVEPEITIKGVPKGGPKQAVDYYCRIGTALNFDFGDSTLNTLLAHMGWVKEVDQDETGLTAKLLETIDPNLLMPENKTEFDDLADASAKPDDFKKHLALADFQDDAVLVNRFFAPKIATYFYEDIKDRPIEPGNIDPGWRKLIRIQPRAGSKADTDKTIKHVYILFNFKSPERRRDPFKQGESGNNQIIIVPKYENPPLEGEIRDNVFFGVYKAQSLGYKLGLFLAADFDLPRNPTTDGKYFVPTSCASCHGHDRERGAPVEPKSGKKTKDYSLGVYPYAKPNYLDTDQWYDWMGYDFPSLTQGPYDVIFDGGKDRTSKDYKDAFDIIRKINKDIKEETRSAERRPTTSSFQLEAVVKWNELHKTSAAYQPIWNRNIGENESWNVGNPDEMALLNKLNNHCFRCHSSMFYNVFDKDIIRARSSSIYRRIKYGSMPLGRTLSEAEKKEILDLIQRVFP